LTGWYNSNDFATTDIFSGLLFLVYGMPNPKTTRPLIQ
jgi:hypothetical protein